MWNLLRNKSWPIGLDIGTDSIKMLQVRKVGAVLGVCACGRWRFPESVGGDASARRKLTIEAVRQMLRQGNFRGRRVVSCLSCSQLSIKNIRLPHVEEDQMRQAVESEARERFPFDVTLDQLAYLNAGQIRQGTEVRDEIILMAARREAVEDHLQMLADMGLTPVYIESEPIALFRVFERFLRRKADEPSVTVVVDIGRSATRVIIARGRQIVFVKNIDIAGRHLTAAVAKQLNLSLEEALDLRLRSMSGQEDAAPAPAAPEGGARAEKDPNSLNWTLRDAIRGETEALAREIALCLRYCSVTFRGIRPDRVNLPGGEAYDPALAQLLGEHLSVECVVAQPLRGIDVSPVDFGTDRRGMLSEWAVAVGLAIRDVRLAQVLPEEDHGQDRLSA